MLPWIAHFYTGLGVVAALLAAMAVIQQDFRAAFLWLAVQVVIDATDGLLARALRVKERLPGFDGAKLDDIIDYLTYVFIPVLIVLRAQLLPPAAAVWIAAFVLLASAYGFNQTAAKVKASDYFFTGFPSYWNIVVLYLYVLELSPMVNALVLIVFGVLVFVPLRYIYPTRTTTLRGLTIGLAAVWTVLLVWIVWRLPAIDGPLIRLSLAFPVYYFVLSLWLDRRSRG